MSDLAPQLELPSLEFGLWRCELAGVALDLCNWMREYGLATQEESEALHKMRSMLEQADDPGSEDGDTDAPVRVWTEVRQLLAQVVARVRVELQHRDTELRNEEQELWVLRDKNHALAERLMRRAQSEHGEYEQSERRVQGLAAVVSRRLQSALDCLSVPALRGESGLMRQRVLSAARANDSKQAMLEFCAWLTASVRKAVSQVDEIHAMVSALHATLRPRGFAEEAPVELDTDKYLREIDAMQDTCGREIDSAFSGMFGRRNALGTAVTTLSGRAQFMYDVANKEIRTWVSGILSPLDAHVLAQHTRLERRLESMRKMYGAVAELDGSLASYAPRHRLSRDLLMELHYLEILIRRCITAGIPAAATVGAMLPPIRPGVAPTHAANDSAMPQAHQEAIAALAEQVHAVDREPPAGEAGAESTSVLPPPADDGLGAPTETLAAPGDVGDQATLPLPGADPAPGHDGARHHHHRERRRQHGSRFSGKEWMGLVGSSDTVARELLPWLNNRTATRPEDAPPDGGETTAPD